MVLDIGTYMQSHPGGDHLLSSNIGQDISKYFYGGYSYNDQIHTHSKFAYFLASKLKIGKLSRHHVPKFVAQVSDHVEVVKNETYTITLSMS